jgi:hypothetical protein
MSIRDSVGTLCFPARNLIRAIHLPVPFSPDFSSKKVAGLFFESNLHSILFAARKVVERIVAAELCMHFGCCAAKM